MHTLSFDKALESIEKLGFSKNDLKMTVTKKYDLADDFAASTYPPGFSLVSLEFYASKVEEKAVLGKAELILLDSSFFDNSDEYRVLGLNFNYTYYLTLSSVRIHNDSDDAIDKVKFNPSDYSNITTRDDMLPVFREIVQLIESTDYHEQTVDLYDKVAYLSHFQVIENADSKCMTNLFFYNLLNVLSLDNDFDFLLVNPNSPLTSDESDVQPFLESGIPLFKFFTAYAPELSYGKLRGDYFLPTLVFDLL